MVDYSYQTFGDDWLQTTDLHCHSFPMFMWDALMQTRYSEEVSEYWGWLYTEHGMPRCEV
jgi:hypothetical protein